MRLHIQNSSYVPLYGPRYGIRRVLVATMTLHEGCELYFVYPVHIHVCYDTDTEEGLVKL